MAANPPLRWNPKDDVLLKNAVEAGTSLESLAKGAVQFSRQFTIQELHDRWYSLLYDPVVSEQAAAHMIGIDNSELANQSKHTKPGSVKEIARNSEKRKAESVQRCYYSMRKRVCSEPVNMTDANLHSKPGNSDFGSGGSKEPPSTNFAIGDPSFALDQIVPFNDLPVFNFLEDESLQNENTYFEFGGTSFHNFGNSSSFTQTPIKSNFRDNSASNLRIEFGVKEQSREGQLILPHSGNVSEAEALRCEFLTPSAEDYLAELFDLPNDELVLMDDIEGKETLEKSFFAGLSSLLLDSPNNNELLNEASDDKGLDYCDAIEVPSSPLTIENLGPEYKNGVICCTLNTEDQEIPSNDDVFLPYRINETPYLLPSSIKNYSNTQKGDQNNNPVLSHDRGLSNPLNLSSNLKIAERKVKFQLPNSNAQRAALGSTRDSGCAVSINSENENSNSNDFIRKEVSVRAENLATGLSNAESCKKGIVANEIEESVSLDQEQLLPEDDEFDIPYSSDVEAMILDMGLSPDEFDLYTHPEVQKYRHEETKRTIIRLEQATDACMQRSMEAKGALAVLYSRSFKHFIMKPEVLLGRPTEDTKVDIDLGREKNGGKISRRQAFMVMDTNGSFHMKNLGKYPICVNGEEVATGQSTNLKSGCLLEIRGLTFVLEMNHAQVKQYVDIMKTTHSVPE